ncbi:MAG TPA: TIGR02301 family protein, partial [Caulobacteraceae bacterium]|nr:TIGR02301 family protein [Caulobacteraceae bacterium]
MKLALVTVLALLAALPTAAQTREETLSNLAFVIGQSHGLRQLCQGPGDQYWRQRMTRLIELEAPDPAARAPLAEHFNDGF